MLVQEESLSNLEEALLYKDMHNTKDEEEETLSLCDLPLYGDQSVDDGEDDLSQDSLRSSSMSSSENDYFEFFSQELNPNTSITTISQPDNIIFCGKLISYKQPNIPRQERKEQNNKKRNWGLFGWKLSSSTRHVHSKTSSSHQFPNKKTNENNNKSGKGYEFPVNKMSILTSSSSGKARWYVLLFGLSRVSTEMDLRDIKNRQSKRLYPSTTTSSPLFRTENNGNDNIIRGRSDGEWGMWGVIRTLSCGSNLNPNTMVIE